MPITAAQNDIWQVRVVGQIDGQETNNVLHFKCVSGGGDTDVDLHLIQVIVQCFVTHLIPVLSSAFTLNKIVWKRVSPTLGLEFTSVVASGGVGLGSAAALPSFCSALLSIHTSQGGRSHRGRMYIPGIPEAATTNSSFDPNHAFWAGLLAYAICLVQNFIPGDPPGNNAWAMGVYSRKIGGANFPYGANGFTQIADVVAVSQIATTRSRKVGRGS